VDAVSNFVTALAVGWFVTAAVIVGVYLWRYAREWARLQEQEARYAEEWVAAHQHHQDRDRFTTDREGAPE
jgi:hypothetical protein